MTAFLPYGIANFGDEIVVPNPWVVGPPRPERIEIVAPRDDWEDRAVALAAGIAGALRGAMAGIEHVGSTAVAGLPAKDVIDLDLIVDDPADEVAYVPALEALGYLLTVREPELSGHRLLRLEEPRVNLHVFGPGSVEVARHVLFRDWLRTNEADRDRYAEAKAAAVTGGAQTVMAYNARKAAVVREIYARAFAARGIPLRDRALAPDDLPPLPTTVGTIKITWRPMTTNDVDILHALTHAAGLIDHPRDLISREVIELSLTGERFVLATDTIIGVASDGTAVAFGEARLGDTWDAEIEVSLDGTVHPEWRGLGIGRALLAWQEARGRQLLAAADVNLPALITTGAREESVSVTELFAAAGFSPVRWWIELGTSLDAEAPTWPIPVGVSLLPYSEEFSEATRGAMNDAFRDHWGSQPTTQREWDDARALSDFAPTLSRVAVTGTRMSDDPYQVIGGVLSEVDEAEWAINGGSFGYVAMVGVVRSWRKRGLASGMIAETLRAYREAGLEQAILDVDSKNPSGALGIYETLGFEPRDRSVTYAKHV